MVADQLKATLTFSQNQTGITTKIQKNHPDQPTEEQLEKSLITKDLRRGSHIEMDRKCGGTRGLAGLPQVAAEVLEVYLGCREEVWV